MLLTTVTRLCVPFDSKYYLQFMSVSSNLVKANDSYGFNGRITVNDI
jgi:hypothetical protein